MLIGKDRSECEACSWQGPDDEVDSGHCPECGGECFEIAQMSADAVESDRMITAKEFADAVGRSTVAVTVWAREGRLPGAVLRRAGSIKFWEIPEGLTQAPLPKRGPKPGPRKKKASTLGPFSPGS